MPGRLEGKVAIITGAGAGIGAATARRFASEGARLVLNELRTDYLEKVVGELSSSGADVVGLAGDASTREVNEALVDMAIQRHGRIDVLYANVGRPIGKLVHEFSDEEWFDQQRVVLDTVFLATRAVLPHMVAQLSGSIIAMSSDAGIGGQYGFGGYAANKAAVISLMETVSMEYGPYNVRANAITPGPTPTEAMIASVGGDFSRFDPIAETLMLKRVSRPEDVANLVLFLASDESSNITGLIVRSNPRAKVWPKTSAT